MVIKRLKGAKFGTDRIARVVTGYATYEDGLILKDLIWAYNARH